MENLERPSLLATAIQYTISLYSVQLVTKNLSQVVKILNYNEDSIDNNLKCVTKQVLKAMMT
jgi:hypothetical protein